MNLDVRIPLGLLFLVLGIILVIFGFTSETAIYARSLGKNINLFWGVIFAIFGAVVLLIAKLKKE